MKPRHSLRQWDSLTDVTFSGSISRQRWTSEFAAAAAEAVRACLDEHSVRLSDIDMIVAAPARPGYRAALSSRLGVAVDRSASLTISACIPPRWRRRSSGRLSGLPAGAQVLFVAAGAGVTAGAALYRQPPRIGA